MVQTFVLVQMLLFLMLLWQVLCLLRLSDACWNRADKSCPANVVARTSDDVIHPTWLHAQVVVLVIIANKLFAFVLRSV